MPVNRRQGCRRSLEKTRRRFAVRHHYDLFHVFALSLQDASREPQAFRGVRMIWPDLSGGELRQRQLFGAVVEQNDLERIARVLGPDQMAEREGDLLGRRETIFAVQNHRVRTVKHHYRGARRLIIALVHVQVAIFEIQRNR